MNDDIDEVHNDVLIFESVAPTFVKSLSYWLGGPHMLFVTAQCKLQLLPCLGRKKTPYGKHLFDSLLELVYFMLWPFLFIPGISKRWPGI